MAEQETNTEAQDPNAKLDQAIEKKGSAGKKSAAAKSSTSKTGAKKPAAKSSAAKAKSEPAPEQPQETKAEAPVEQPAVTEQPQEEVVEQPKEEAVEEVKAEEHQAMPQEEAAEEPKAEEPAEKPAAPAANGLAAKTDSFIKGKGKLPIFIAVNALFFLSGLLLLLNSFNIGGKNFNVFSYMGHGDEIKFALLFQAADWAGGAYNMIGIFMFFSFLVPWALAGKNLFFFFRKQDKSVRNADALISLGFMMFYLAIVNLYGANVTFGQIFALIVATLVLAFTLLTRFLTKNVKSLPFFSLVNILLAMFTIFILVGPSVKVGKGNYMYAAMAASAANAGGFFVMLFFAIVALIVLIIMQMKRLPRIIEIAVPIAAAGLALLSLIILGACVSKNLLGAKVAGGFVFGVILTILIAGADTALTFVKPLNKYKKMVDDSDDGNGNNELDNSYEEAAKAKEPASAAQSQEAQPAKEEEEAKVFCSACGAANSPKAAYCKNCGHRMQ